MLLSLFLTFLKIGLFTFGGGYAMISNIREVVVEKKKWLDEDELLEVIAIAESTPGPIAINLATYVGYKRRGFFGSLRQRWVWCFRRLPSYIASRFFLMRLWLINTLRTHSSA